MNVQQNSNSGNRDDLNEKTRLIIDAALDAIIGIDINGKIIIWNPQAEALFGWTRQEILGESLTEKIVPERFRERHDSGFRHYIQTGEQTTLNRKLEIFAINRDAYEFPIELSILPIKENGHEFFCAFIRDISERKKSEKILTQQKEFLESLINGLPGIFYLYNEQRQFLLWNHNFQVVSGYSSDEIKGMEPLQFFEGDERDLVGERIATVFENGEAEVEAHFITKRSERLPYLFSGCRILVDGKPCLMGMGIDLSEKVRLQAEFDKKTRQIQQVMTTAVITAQETERSKLGQELHDNVGQVLTTVKLYVEMLRDGILQTPDLFNKALDHLQQSIDEIRRISKRLSAPTLGSITLIESIKELVESINLTRRVHILYDIDGVSTKEVNQKVHLAIYRIVQEQLNNIIKYAEATEVRILIKKVEAHLSLSIQDDGKGFDLKARREGIGLNNMKTRAESLGGSFKLSTQPAKGCRIDVSIPIAPGE
ncbi:MAG: PAS domain-containing sensor histidine kinase [Sphingobacteriales bacterium]|nr:MAG: PAS domain-containing sensor histidine kinase [Sphingobacteriales bacterium]